MASALDNKQDCVALFVDLSKADTVDHQILLKRLRSTGLDEMSCNWFTNYLSSGTQAVVADGYQSSFMRRVRRELHCILLIYKALPG